MPLADTLLRLGSGRRLYLPKWTGHIMDEVNRNLRRNFGLTDQQVTYRASEISRHFPEAWVGGYEHMIPAMTNHPKDRHVLAAAVHCRAELIVTHNLKHFPPSALEGYSITAMGPSAFLNTLFECDSEFVTVTLKRQARAIGRPLHYVLDRLSANAPGFVQTFRAKG